MPAEVPGSWRDGCRRTVQEALGKQEEVPGAAWHLICHLQTNKVKKVSGKFELIHS